MQTYQAMKLARESGLDLVEISPTANPPVCKVMDYGRYKYQAKKREQEARKKQITVQVKEIKLRPVTDEHDLEFKLRHVKRFLEEGHKVKITVVHRGREMAHIDRGEAMLGRVLKEVSTYSQVEKPSRMEGKALTLILAPKH